MINREVCLGRHKKMKLLFVICLLVPQLVFAGPSWERMDVVNINRISNEQIYIMTKNGGDNFWMHDVRITFNASIDYPQGYFVLTDKGIWRWGNSCTLVFKDRNQAKEWLGDTGKVSVRDNVDSNIAVAYSESKGGECFISTLSQ